MTAARLDRIPEPVCCVCGKPGNMGQYMVEGKLQPAHLYCAEKENLDAIEQARPPVNDSGFWSQ